MNDAGSRREVLMGHRCGKSLAAIEAARAAQAMGQRVLFATFDQAATASMLAKHGALSEVIGAMYLRPMFRADKESSEWPIKR